MARKDTMKALINRDVSEETAALLLTKYNSLSAISAAGESELIELGLMEEEARSVLAKIGKRPSSSSRVKKEVEETVPVEPMEEVTNFYQYNEGELRLKAIAERLEIRLPMKIIVDIAARIKNADLSDEICEKLITTANRMYLGTARPNRASDLNTRYFWTKKFTVWAAAVATRKLRNPHRPRSFATSV